MIKEIKNLLKALLVLVFAVLIIIPASALPQSLEGPEFSQVGEMGQHILNCQRPMGHHLYFKEYTCPVGGEKFKSLDSMAYSTFGKHLDWEPVSYMEFPVPLQVCPSNGFIIDKKEYSDAELEKRRAVIESPEYKKLFAERHAGFYLLAHWNRLLKEKPDNDWWFLLTATWEADQCKDSGKYRQYAQEAIQSAKLALKKSPGKDIQYWVLNIIIPNLHRRIGDFETAQAWLDTFGNQLPEDKKSREFFELAFKALRQAVSEKVTAQIKIERPKKVKR